MKRESHSVPPPKEAETDLVRTSIPNAAHGDAQAWEEQVRAHLDAHADQLDGQTRSALSQIRHQALAGSRQSTWAAWFAPLATSAAALLLAIGLSLGYFTPAPEASELLSELEAVPADMTFAVGDDAQALDPELDALLVDAVVTVDGAGADKLELIENLEFYLWLQTQSSQG